MAAVVCEPPSGYQSIPQTHIDSRDTDYINPFQLHAFQRPMRQTNQTPKQCVSFTTSLNSLIREDEAFDGLAAHPHLDPIQIARIWDTMNMPLNIYSGHLAQNVMQRSGEASRDDAESSLQTLSGHAESPWFRFRSIFNSNAL